MKEVDAIEIVDCDRSDTPAMTAYMSDSAHVHVFQTDFDGVQHEVVFTRGLLTGLVQAVEELLTLKVAELQARIALDDAKKPR